MGASRLRQIARVLELPVEFFYDGAPSQSEIFPSDLVRTDGRNAEAGKINVPAVRS